jgi:hypothetical protein
VPPPTGLAITLTVTQAYGLGYIISRLRRSEYGQPWKLSKTQNRCETQQAMNKLRLY